MSPTRGFADSFIPLQKSLLLPFEFLIDALGPGVANVFFLRSGPGSQRVLEERGVDET